VFYVPKNGLEWIFECFLFQELVRNGIPKFFLLRKWFGTEFRGFFSSKNGSEQISKVLLIPNGSERNSKSFSLLGNGSEQNSEVFLFSETGGIPTEMPPVSSCSVFRKNNFFAGKWQSYPHPCCSQTGREGERDKYSAGRKNKKENKCICCIIIFLENCFSP
jgi:hypothetical protein